MSQDTNNKMHNLQEPKIDTTQKLESEPRLIKECVLVVFKWGELLCSSVNVRGRASMFKGEKKRVAQSVNVM